MLSGLMNIGFLLFFVRVVAVASRPRGGKKQEAGGQVAGGGRGSAGGGCYQANKGTAGQQFFRLGWDSSRALRILKKNRHPCVELFGLYWKSQLVEYLGQDTSILNIWDRGASIEHTTIDTGR